MASPVEISNMALANLGAENLVSSIDPPDGSVEAGYCATFYPLARTVALEAAKPAFAITRTTLAQTTNPTTRWAYAYARPSDCLKPLRIPPPTSALFNEDETPVQGLDLETAPFELEGQLILTDQADAVLVYVFDQDDTTRWTPLFTDAVAATLAGYLAGPLIKGREGAGLGQQWRQQGYQLGAAAAASIANATDEPARFTTPALLARR